MAKVVIIDDQLDILNLTSYTLKYDHDVFSASSGSEGIELINKELPDIILLDMHMPKMSGYEVVQKLRKNEKTKHIPVMAITASVAESNKEKIKEAGCDDYLSKPFDPQNLEEKVKDMLQNIGVRRA